MFEKSFVIFCRSLNDKACHYSDRKSSIGVLINHTARTAQSILARAHSTPVAQCMALARQTSFIVSEC